MGYGDDIMITARCKRLKKENPDYDIVIVKGKIEAWSPIYENNPNIKRFKEARRKIIRCQIRPRPYIHSMTSTNFIWKKHKPKPGEIFLTNEEKKFSTEKLQYLSDIVYIEPNVKGTVSANNKDWGFKKWQSVVDAFPNITFVQAGEPTSKILNGVHFFKTPTIREALALLKNAKIFLGSDGALHHASAAFKIPAIVIFGGFVSPQQTGYDIHTNFYIDDPESPCGSKSSCNHCRRCMEQITVEQVIKAVKDIT